jgi:hypothetical protein
MKTIPLITLLLFHVGIVLSFFLLPAYAPFDSAQGDTGHTGDNRIAWIDFDEQNDLLHIRGMFYNATDKQQTVTYKLTTERTGKAGTSRTSQSGEHCIAPADTAELSRTSVNLAPEDCYTLTLDVFERNTKIATDKILYCSDDDQGEDS